MTINDLVTHYVYLLRAFPVSTDPDSYQLDFGRGEWEGAE